MAGAVGAVASMTLLVLTGQGCQDQATPAAMQDGVHNITKSMGGFWDSPGGTGCRWRKYDQSGNLTGRGGGTVSQTVLFVFADFGGKFKSDRCHLWSPK